MQGKIGALSTGRASATEPAVEDGRVAEETPLSAARSEALGPGSDGETTVTNLLRLMRQRRQPQVVIIGLPLHEENITRQWTAILQV
jgi:RNase H-fold protein (predicted Holliday junction resolvase)